MTQLEELLIDFVVFSIKAAAVITVIIIVVGRALK